MRSFSWALYVYFFKGTLSAAFMRGPKTTRRSSFNRRAPSSGGSRRRLPPVVIYVGLGTLFSSIDARIEPQ
jgi:hypothetical protein